MRQYEQCVRVLEEELGAEPDRRTRELYEGIRADRASEGKPVWREAGGGRRHNLPHRPTRFIGREREMAEVGRLLEGTHLLTLSGAGGCGKTRLALEVASRVVAEYADGVWLVDLAPLFDRALVQRAVATALGVWEQPGTPMVETLASFLRRKQILLVLDNCEHLIQACAELVNGLLERCEYLKLLATSREPLSISGEVVWRVPSLSFPGRNDDGLYEAADLAHYEAANLFVDRAMSVLPAFALTQRNTGRKSSGRQGKRSFCGNATETGIWPLRKTRRRSSIDTNR